MTVSSKIDAVDRLGMAILALLGAPLGLLIASASDIRLTPTLLIMVPGLAVGVPVGSAWGATTGVIACGMVNGLSYAVLLYGWYRLAGGLRNRLPLWFASAGMRLSRALSRSPQS